MYLGALEAGGTKMVLSTGDENGNIFDRVSFPTTTPAETMPKIIDYFREKKVEALGVGSFGPVDLATGYITTTPKKGWEWYPILPTLKEALGIPMGFDNDVDVAAISEHAIGAAKGLNSCVYLTVGTGIGAGVVADNRILHGMMTLEVGHIILRAHPDDPMPEGSCAFHKGCLEGMASGTSIGKRWGIKAQDLPDDHLAWKLEAYYLAQFCMNAILMYSPEKIVLGGGVMHKSFLFPMIGSEVLRLLGGYMKNDNLTPETIGNYIVPPALGDNAGAAGSLLIAAEALRNA